MQWQLLWYVLAGLIIGLTASTLWEWLYFRRKRLGLHDQRVTELEAEVQLLRAQNQTLIRLAARTTTIPTDYHSPGVFLESEEAESLRDEVYAPPGEDVQPDEPIVDTPMVDVGIETSPDGESDAVIDPEPNEAEVAEGNNEESNA